MGLNERKWRKSTTLLILGAGLVLFSLIYYAGGINGQTFTGGIPYFVCGLLFFAFGLKRRTEENRQSIEEGSPRSTDEGDETLTQGVTND